MIRSTNHDSRTTIHEPLTRTDRSGAGLRAHAFLWLVCAAVVLVTHAPFLRLPYYWDEAGYYVPAARELAEYGRLLPRTAAVNPHPPVLSLYLAAAWKLFGFHPLVTRVAMSLVAATAVYALLLLATVVLPSAGPGAGLWAAALLMVSPLFFAQSTLAHLDVAATAAALLAVYFFLRGRLGGYLVSASLLCLTRETGAAVVLVLAAVSAVEGRRARDTALLLLPLLPLTGWFAFLRLATGHWLGDPGFVAYNVWEAARPARFLVTLLRRLYYLLAADFRGVLAAPLLWTVFRAWRRGPAQRPASTSGMHSALVLLVAVQVLVVSALGGAVLDRYLLPALALFYLLAVEALWQIKTPRRGLVLAALLLVEVGCWFWNPPYPFPYEENLAYADFVSLHQEAAARAALLPEGTRVLTSWPATDELRRPELGYVNRPVRVVAVEDFSEESLARVQREDFDAVLLYSREWQPPWNLLEKWPLLGRLRRRLYGRRPQAAPEWVRAKFDLNSAGSIHLRGQWVEWLERTGSSPGPGLRAER